MVQRVSGLSKHLQCIFYISSVHEACTATLLVVADTDADADVTDTDMK